MPNIYGLPKEAISQLCGVLSQYPAIHSVRLYGSRAKGNYRVGSDIDLSIQAPTLDLTDLLAIENQIDVLLLHWTVDLSLLSHIDNPELIDHIRRIGIPFYEQAVCPPHALRPAYDQPVKHWPNSLSALM